MPNSVDSEGPRRKPDDPVASTSRAEAVPGPSTRKDLSPRRSRRLARERRSSGSDSDGGRPTHVYGPGPSHDLESPGPRSPAQSDRGTPEPRPAPAPTLSTPTRPPSRSAATSASSARFRLPGLPPMPASPIGSQPQAAVPRVQPSGNSALRTELIQKGIVNEGKKTELLEIEVATGKRKIALLDEQIQQAQIKSKTDALEFWYKKKQIEKELGEECPITLGIHNC